MDFVVVDVETANTNPASICQIAVASFAHERLVNVWGTFVDSGDFFLRSNTRLHGISAKNVFGSPTWTDLQSDLRKLLEGNIIASHTEFDRRAMSAANQRCGLRSIKGGGWIDTCSVARRVWPHLPNHKLSSLARTFRIPYRAHDAREDARCAGEILIRAAKTSGLSITVFL